MNCPAECGENISAFDLRSHLHKTCKSTEVMFLRPVPNPKIKMMSDSDYDAICFGELDEMVKKHMSQAA